MRAVLISVNKPNTDNIHKGIKTSELRTKPPRIPTPFRVYMYETLKGGGCGKVVSEWECTDIKEWRMCIGVPAHLSKVACVSNDYIWKYCGNGKKNISEMVISNLVIYDKPRELGEFIKPCIYGEESDVSCFCCEKSGYKPDMHIDCFNTVTRPPQSWCYVEA